MRGCACAALWRRALSGAPLLRTRVRAGATRRPRRTTLVCSRQAAMPTSARMDWTPNAIVSTIGNAGARPWIWPLQARSLRACNLGIGDGGRIEAAMASRITSLDVSSSLTSNANCCVRHHSAPRASARCPAVYADRRHPPRAADTGAVAWHARASVCRKCSARCGHRPRDAARGHAGQHQALGRYAQAHQRGGPPIVGELEQAGRNEGENLRCEHDRECSISEMEPDADGDRGDGHQAG